MTASVEHLQNELEQRHRSAKFVVLGFLGLSLALLAVAFFAARFIVRPGDPSVVMGLWIAILVFGLGAFVLRRTKFAALRLQDIAAVQGPSALLRTLQDTTIQVASIGGAIALMGFIITILRGNWFDMLRATGVAAIVLIYCYPIRSAWQRALTEFSRER
jgi:predicted lysophospholipase L1 biosynthesis ABC-type transport system permease subunit